MLASASHCLWRRRTLVVADNGLGLVYLQDGPKVTSYKYRVKYLHLFRGEITQLHMYFWPFKGPITPFTTSRWPALYQRFNLLILQSPSTCILGVAQTLSHFYDANPILHDFHCETVFRRGRTQHVLNKDYDYEIISYL